MVETRTQAELDTWNTPARKGDTYCSPFCGHGCKHADFLFARKRAYAMKRKMGHAWKARVHENLGWHASIYVPAMGDQYVVSIGCNVYKDRITYTCIINGVRSVSASADTPQAAYADTLGQFKQLGKLMDEQVRTLP